MERFVNFEGIFSFYGFQVSLKLFFVVKLMDDRQLVCYPRIGTCSRRS